MADNIAVTAGSGTTIATDDCAGVQYQRVKLTDATADSTTPTGVAANPLQVSLANHGANATAVKVDGSAVTQPVSGTVAITNAGITSIDGKITACNTGAVVVSSGALNADLRVAGAAVTTSNPVPIMPPASGSLAINDAGGAITVDGTVAVTNAGITSIDGKITACNTGAVVLAAGTAGIGKLTANSGVDIGDVDVLSLPAITGAVTANPSKLATTDDADFVRKYYTNAGAVTDGIIWSPASGKRWYVTDLIINTSAAATITLEDDLAGGDAVVMKFELAANGGTVINFRTPLASGEDAADLLVTTSAGNIYITAVGYEV